MIEVLTQTNSHGEKVCEHTDINVDWCAHCLGHVLAPEYEEALRAELA